jgi:hypothetical protein
MIVIKPIHSGVRPDRNAAPSAFMFMRASLSRHADWYAKSDIKPLRPESCQSIP